MKRIINNIIIKTHIVYRIYQEVWYGGGDLTVLYPCRYRENIELTRDITNQ